MSPCCFYLSCFKFYCGIYCLLQILFLTLANPFLYNWVWSSQLSYLIFQRLYVSKCIESTECIQNLLFIPIVSIFTTMFFLYHLSGIIFTYVLEVFTHTMLLVYVLCSFISKWNEFFKIWNFCLNIVRKVAFDHFRSQVDVVRVLVLCLELGGRSMLSTYH